MKLLASRISTLLVLTFLCTALVSLPKSLFQFRVKDISGNSVSLNQYKGKVILVVNVASKCQFTDQYKEIQALYDEYSDQGLVVLAFPSNDFDNQEPGTEDEIKRFCTRKYGVTFPMFSKINVKGEKAHPLYKFLAKEGGKVQWNFNKYLINRKGKVVKNFKPRVSVKGKKFKKLLDKELAKR